jgi:hypothetical protein
MKTPLGSCTCLAPANGLLLSGHGPYPGSNATTIRPVLSHPEFKGFQRCSNDFKAFQSKKLSPQFLTP